MSWNIKESEATIYKNESGSYYGKLMTRMKRPDGEESLRFMNIKIEFKYGVEVKNRTKIKVNNGFLTFYEYHKPMGNGNTQYTQTLKIKILDFDVIEEGIDTPETFTKKNDMSNAFSFYSANDDLPF